MKPILIELANREVSATNSGTEIRNTWYVEPYNAWDCVVASLLGVTDKANPNAVTLVKYPTCDYVFPYMMCVDAAVVPQSQVQFGQMVGTTFELGQLAGAGNVLDYTGTVMSGGHLRPGAPAPDDPQMDMMRADGTDNRRARQGKAPQNQYLPGCFIEATYRPIISLADESASINAEDYFRYCNFTKAPAEITHQINGGLKLAATQPAPGGLRLLDVYQPSTGTSPVFRENYLNLYVDRMYCTDKVAEQLENNAIPNLVNHVNEQQMFNFSTVLNKHIFDAPTETMVFQGYERETIRVPSVDKATGEADGYSQWHNFRFKFGQRLLKTAYVDRNGHLVNNGVITWQHVLAYPGTLNAVWNIIPNALGLRASGLHWYYSYYGNTPFDPNIRRKYPLSAGGGNAFNDLFNP